MPDATVTAPVVVFNVIPVGHVPLCETVAFVPIIAGLPFTISLLAMLVIAVPPVEGVVPFSVTGLMLGVTKIVSVTVAQCGVGVAKSHS